MEPIVLAYLILGCTMIFALLIVVLKIAGRDIFYAMYRWFQPKGADIFVLNANRHFDHFYKVPKDGIFKINDRIYLTNPDKTEGLSDEMVEEVNRKMDLKLKRLNTLIEKAQKKQEFIKAKLDSIERKEENIPILDNLQLQYTTLENRIELFKSKKQEREQSYFMRRRSCYLYIENDPVPKDMFEFYTEMDSVQLENVIVRSQTKDAGKSIANMEASLTFLKKFIIIACGLAGLALWFAFKTHDAVNQIATSMGIHISI